MAGEPMAPAAPEKESNPMEIITEIQKALVQVGDALQGAPLPPEALKKLDESVAAYDEFVALAGGPKVMGEEPMAKAGPSDVGGRRGAMPSDMPMGPKGSRPVQAY